MLKEFSERHEKDREPFEEWRTRTLGKYSICPIGGLCTETECYCSKDDSTGGGEK